MRLVHLGFAITLGGAVALAQSSTSTYITDINGHREDASTVDSSDHTHTDLWQSINGRQVPLQQVEERVISESGGTKVTERIVKKFSPGGDLASTERTVTEEQKTSQGSTVHETVFRSDVNGRMSEAERRTSQTLGSGANTTSEISIARPNLDGTMQTVEKRSLVSTGTDSDKKSTETVYRLGPNGGLVEAIQQVTASTKQGDRTTNSSSYYEPGMNGTMELKRQSVATTIKGPGGDTTEVNLYARTVPGVVVENSGAQALTEQQVIERRKNPDGSVVETLSVRRPTINDPKQLGPAQRISETVCSGKCD